MRPLFLIASIAATAMSGTAISRQLPPRPMAEGSMTRADALARADQRFALIDTDHDGRITAAERAAMPRPRGPMPVAGTTPPAGATADAPPPPPRSGRRGPGGGMGGARGIERADTNRDGIVTREEFTAQAAAMFDGQDLNKDGTVDAAERRQLREQRMERRGDRTDD